jgi:septal ring factor EnvC (AmiA/AmiB activator)
MEELRQSGLNRAEVISIAGVISAVAISAIGGLVNYGSQNQRVENLQHTVVNLNQSVTTLNQTLQLTREELATVKAQREGTEKALADIKSSLDRLYAQNRY